MSFRFIIQLSVRVINGSVSLFTQESERTKSRTLGKHRLDSHAITFQVLQHTPTSKAVLL